MSTKAAVWQGGTRLVWRSLTLAEFHQIVSSTVPTAEKYLEVYKVCRIEGPSVQLVSAGIVDWLGKQELNKSPFTGKFEFISQSLHKARNTVTENYLLAAQALIASVFKISFDEIAKWDSDTFFIKVAQAEFISGRPLEPTHPEPISKDVKTDRVKKELTPAQKLALERRAERKKSLNTS